MHFNRWVEMQEKKIFILKLFDTNHMASYPTQTPILNLVLFITFNHVISKKLLLFVSAFDFF